MHKRLPVNIAYTAQRDIQEIWQFFIEESRESAEKFIKLIERQILSLEFFSERCPPVPESEQMGVEYRQLLAGDYRVIFRNTETAILIMRVLHKTRLVETACFDELEEEQVVA